ncbi:B3 domain-containing protein [Capsicum galapagoense]
MEKENSTTKKIKIESSEIQEINDGKYWPVSEEKSYIDMILTKSNVKPIYSLYIPKKMNKELPSAGAPVVLTYGRKEWHMFYGGIKFKHKLIEWKKFANDNNLKEGDGLLLELIECSTSKIHFRVQILNGDFPAELIPKYGKGATSEELILID